MELSSGTDKHEGSCRSLCLQVALVIFATQTQLWSLD